MNQETHDRRYRGSLFFPLLLITLGIVFLLDNMKLLPGGVWNTIVQLWPVLLILIGLDSIFRRHGLVGPVILIIVGGIFLLANFGMLAVNVWDAILGLWPILLIAIGFDLVVGRRSIWGSLLALAVILAILVGAVWFTMAGVVVGQAMPGETINQPLQGADQATVILKPAVGNLTVTAFQGGNELVRGEVRKWQGEQVRQNYVMQDGRAVFTLASQGSTFWFPGGSRANAGWQVALNSGMPLTLQVSMGVGEMNLDLRDLQLNRLDVEMGVGNGVVWLPGRRNLQANLNGAIGNLVLVIPAQAAARIRTQAAITAVEVPAGFARQDNTYTSPGFDSARERIEIDLSQAIGRMAVQQR